MKKLLKNNLRKLKTNPEIILFVLALILFTIIAIIGQKEYFNAVGSNKVGVSKLDDRQSDKASNSSDESSEIRKVKFDKVEIDSINKAINGQRAKIQNLETLHDYQ